MRRKEEEEGEGGGRGFRSVCTGTIYTGGVEYKSFLPD